MFKTVLVTLLIAFFSFGCDCPCAAETEDMALENTQWKLVSFGRTRMAVPKKAWIKFQEDKYSGYAGCNGMGGEVEIKGDTMMLKSGFSTLMACSDMRLETKFRQEMSKVNSYEVQGDTLILKHDDHAVLNFIAQC